MSYYARSVFRTTNIAIWQLGVVLGSQHLLFVTWGHHVHQERGLIVAMDVCDLLGPLSFTRILEDNVCGEIFMLCSFRQQASTLSRYSVDVEGDYVIFSVPHRTLMFVYVFLICCGGRVHVYLCTNLQMESSCQPNQTTNRC
jgi:hypothetical protein